MDWPEILSSATVAILAVWLGATVVSRAPADRAARLFALLALVLAFWAGSRALEPLASPEASPVLNATRNASAYLLPPLLAHLVAAFASIRIPPSRLLVIGFGYAAAVPLAIRAFTDPERPFHVDAPHFSLPGIEGEVFGWAWILVRLAVLAAAAWWAWRYVSDVRTDPSRVRKAASVLAAVLLGAVGAALLILPTLSRPPLWFSVSLVGLALVCATYAVIAQRVFLAHHVARQAVSSTLAGGLLVTAMIVVLFALEALADRALGLGLPIVTAVVLALSLAVYDPARLAWRRLMTGLGRGGAETVLPRGIAPDRLGAQQADDSIAPALDRLVWRFELVGARVVTPDGRVVAEAGSVGSPAVELPLGFGSRRWGQLLIGVKQSGLPFGDAETLVLEQSADYVAAALHLGERQRQHAAERAALVAEREAQDVQAKMLAAAVETEATPALRVYALGPLRAEVGDTQVVQWGGKKAGSRQAEGIFAFLFDRGEKGVAKDELLDLIWPDVPMDRADVAFHRTMNGLRRTLTPAGATINFFNDRYHLALDPLTGVLDEHGSIGSMSDPRTQPGPMARRVEDLGTLLAILAGPDGIDGGSIPVPVGDPAGIDLRGLRVMLQRSDGVAPPDVGTERALRDAAAALAEAGVTVVEAAPPPGGHELTERVWDSHGDEMTASELYGILREWDAYRTTMLALLERFDLILSPVAPEPAPLHGGAVIWRYTTPHSLTGWPCLVVRAGISADMPVGVQLVSGPWQDHVAIAAASAVESALGGWLPPAAGE